MGKVKGKEYNVVDLSDKGLVQDEIDWSFKPPEILKLNRNKISSLGLLPSFPSLLTLDLSNNYISDLSGCRMQPNLTELNIRKNPFNDFSYSRLMILVVVNSNIKIINGKEVTKRERALAKVISNQHVITILRSGCIIVRDSPLEFLDLKTKRTFKFDESERATGKKLRKWSKPSSSYNDIFTTPLKRVNVDQLRAAASPFKGSRKKGSFIDLDDLNTVGQSGSKLGDSLVQEQPLMNEIKDENSTQNINSTDEEKVKTSGANVDSTSYNCSNVTRDKAAEVSNRSSFSFTGSITQNSPLTKRVVLATRSTDTLAGCPAHLKPDGSLETVIRIITEQPYVDKPPGDSCSPVDNLDAPVKVANTDHVVDCDVRNPRDREYYMKPSSKSKVLEPDVYSYSAESVSKSYSTNQDEALYSYYEEEYSASYESYVSTGYYSSGSTEYSIYRDRYESETSQTEFSYDSRRHSRSKSLVKSSKSKLGRSSTRGNRLKPSGEGKEKALKGNRLVNRSTSRIREAKKFDEQSIHKSSSRRQYEDSKDFHLQKESDRKDRVNDCLNESGKLCSRKGNVRENESLLTGDNTGGYNAKRNRDLPDETQSGRDGVRSSLTAVGKLRDDISKVPRVSDRVLEASNIDSRKKASTLCYKNNDYISTRGFHTPEVDKKSVRIDTEMVGNAKEQEKIKEDVQKKRSQSTKGDRFNSYPSSSSKQSEHDKKQSLKKEYEHVKVRCVTNNIQDGRSKGHLQSKIVTNKRSVRSASRDSRKTSRSRNYDDYSVDSYSSSSEMAVGCLKGGFGLCTRNDSHSYHTANKKRKLSPVPMANNNKKLSNSHRLTKSSANVVASSSLKNKGVYIGSSKPIDDERRGKNNNTYGRVRNNEIMSRSADLKKLRATGVEKSNNNGNKQRQGNDVRRSRKPSVTRSKTPTRDQTKRRKN